MYNHKVSPNNGFELITENKIYGLMIIHRFYFKNVILLFVHTPLSSIFGFIFCIMDKISIISESVYSSIL